MRGAAGTAGQSPRGVCGPALQSRLRTWNGRTARAVGVAAATTAAKGGSVSEMSLQMREVGGKLSRSCGGERASGGGGVAATPRGWLSYLRVHPVYERHGKPQAGNRMRTPHSTQQRIQLMTPRAGAAERPRT
jgi:hypothetical protein